jgi:hypothetical protein
MKGFWQRVAVVAYHECEGHIVAQQCSGYRVHWLSVQIGMQ